MMRIFRRLVARIRYRHFDDDLQQELAAHRAMLEDEARARGASPAEARVEAVRQLGNATLARETARDVWIAPWLEGLWQDVRYAARSLRASPTLTIPALAVLIVAMALTTTLYTVAEVGLFRPWPVPDPKEVVIVRTERNRTMDIRGEPQSYTVSIGVAEYRYLQANTPSIGLVAMAWRSHVMGIPGLAWDERRAALLRVVSGNYFEALRVPVAAGRGLLPADDVPGGSSAVVVLSHGTSQRQFGGISEAVGSVLHLDGVPFTVIGVAAAGAGDTQEPNAWIPLHAVALLSPRPGNEAAERFLNDPGSTGAEIAARLGADIDRRTAEAQLNVLSARYATDHGLMPARMSLTGTSRVNSPGGSEAIRIYTLVTLAVLLILLLGCANVGNLQLARGLSRRGDVTIRLALGATRGRLVRLVLVEGLILSTSAAIVSVFLTRALLVAAQQWIEPGAAAAPIFGGGTLVLAIALASGACMLSSLLPALKNSTPGAGRLADRSRLRGGLLGFQVASSAILLLAAAILVRSIHHATGAGLGFMPHGVVAVDLGGRWATGDPDERRQLSTALLEAASSAGLGPIAGATVVPFTNHPGSWQVRLPDGGAAPAGQTVTLEVTPEYFDVLGIPLLVGRVFETTTPPDQVVINEALARRLWPGQPAPGRVFRDGELDLRVIGVVADARTAGFNAAAPAYYTRAEAFSSVLIRGDPAAIAHFQAIVRRLEPAASPEFTELASGVGRGLQAHVAGAVVAAALGGIALLLAAAGTLGVFWFAVAERTREIAVRTTLGARRRDIVGMIAARAGWPLAGGVATGLVGAQMLGHLLDGYLLGISPRDPVAYAAVLVILAGTASAAMWIPARRALRVDPAVTLRAE